MPLSFDFTDVDNHKEVTTDPADDSQWHPVADALVWLSVICGYDKITLKNVRKVTTRIMAYQAVVSAYLPFDVYITPVDIQRFVGLRTNATPLTDAAFNKKLGEIAIRRGHALCARLNRHKTPSALAQIAAAAADKA